MNRAGGQVNTESIGSANQTLMLFKRSSLIKTTRIESGALTSASVNETFGYWSRACTHLLTIYYATKLTAQ